MSYLPKYIMDRMFRSGAVSLDGQDLYITMTALLRPIRLDSIRNLIISIRYLVLGVPTVNNFGLLGDTLIIKTETTEYTKSDIGSSIETIEIGELFTVKIPNVSTDIKVDMNPRFTMTIAIYNPIILRFIRPISTYITP